MSRAKWTWVIAGVVVILPVAVVLQNLKLDDSDAKSTNSTIREYGSLASTSSSSGTGTGGIANRAAETVPTNHDSPGGQHGVIHHGGEVPRAIDTTNVINGDPTSSEDTSSAADAYRISGRPMRDFDRESLARSGYSDAEIDNIAEAMRGYATWLRDASGGELPAPAIKLSLEERAARRETREVFLSDDEYAAALFATGQKNAAVFARPNDGTPAWEAGIRSGDKLVSINGVRIFDLTDFADGRGQRVDGQMHILEVSRRGEQTMITVACCRPGWGPVDMTTRVPADVGTAE